MIKLNINGFSLFELLLAITIGAVVSLIFVGIISQNTELFSNQSVKISHGLELNRTQPIIEEIIKTSSGIVAQYPTTGQAQYTSDNQTIVLSTPSMNAQGGLMSGTFDYIVIAKDTQNPKILRKLIFVDPSSSRKSGNEVLVTKLSMLEFKYYNTAGQTVAPIQSTKIRYIINLEDLVATESKISSISGQINLRND